MRPILSIIVPVYNVEIFLKQCIDSILSQTFYNFELILVDDGSPDNSGIICDEYSKLDNRIKVVHQENGGLSAARNVGIDIAEGEYIGFVDSDDWIDSEMYEKLYKRAVDEKSDIVACNYYCMDKYGGIKPRVLNAIDLEYDKESAMKEIFTNNILAFSAFNKIYKRDLFDNLRYKEGIIVEDMDIAYKLVFRSKKISFLKDCLYYYRYNANSILRKKFNMKRLDEYFVKKDMYHFYALHYPELENYLYFELCVTGIILYTYICIYFPTMSREYKYLVNLDHKRLKLLIKNDRLNFKNRVRVRIFMFSPKLHLLICKNLYRIMKKR